MDLAARRPVWRQLSELYLDTELDASALQSIGRILAESPYTVAELHEIELWEVAPVVSRNLLSMAGEWAGFDDAWLHAECERRAQRRSLRLRIGVGLGFQRFVRWATGEYWLVLAPAIDAQRRR